MNNEQDRYDRQLAMAAIALDHAADTGDGEKPDFEELWDWSAGQLSGVRASQIQSHVARDPDIYAQWREIRLALEETVNKDMASDPATHNVAPPLHGRNANGQESTTKIKSGLMETIFNWLTPAQLGGGFATAAILGVAVSIGLNQSDSPPNDFWSDWQSPKSLEAPDLDDAEVAELQAFLAGMGKQMGELSIPAFDPAGRSLPEQVPECSIGDESCDTRRALLYELGELSVKARLECMVVDSDNALQQQAQRQRLQDIAQSLASDNAVTRLILPLQDWAAADNIDARCGAVSSLIQRGLVGIAI